MSEEDNFLSVEAIKKKSKDIHVVNKGSLYHQLVKEHYEKQKCEEEKQRSKAERRQMLKNIFKLRKDSGPEYIDYENRIDKIKDAVIKGRSMLKKDIYAARTMYTMLEELYKELPKPLKAKAFLHIRPFHKELEKEIKLLQDGIED